MKKLIKAGIITFVACAIVVILLFVKKEMRKHPGELTLYGNIEIRQVDLGFRVAGRIGKMYFEEGDIVKEGALLGVLDDSPYAATLEKTAAQVVNSKAVYDDALSKYERNLPLCHDHTVSEQECTTLFNTKEQAKGALDTAIGAQKEANINLQDTKIFAPCDGVVTTRIQEPGAIVTASQPIYSINKTKPIWVRAYVPETNLANVKYGMKARVLTDTVDPNTGKKREYTGWVGYISPVAEFTPKTVQTEELRTDLVYRIRVYIYDIDPHLRQGMPTTIKINLNTNEVRKRVDENEDKTPLKNEITGENTANE